LQDYYHSSQAEQGLLARDFFLSQGGAADAAGLSPSRLPPGTGLRESAAAAAAAEAARGADQHRSSATFVVYAISIALTMAVSLAVWPGVTAFFCSVDNPATSSPCAPRGAHPGIWGRLTGDLFTPITFVAFGVGDLIGRVASSWGPWGRRPPAAAALLVYALARFGIGAGILVCNVVTPAPWRLPVLVHSDWASLGLIVLLGLTQVCCVCMGSLCGGSLVSRV
jgi:hypothetical protein